MFPYLNYFVSLSELKESIVALRDKNYKNTRPIKDAEKKIDDRVQPIDLAENTWGIRLITKPILN